MTEENKSYLALQLEELKKIINERLRPYESNDEMQKFISSKDVKSKKEKFINFHTEQYEEGMRLLEHRKKFHSSFDGSRKWNDGYIQGVLTQGLRDSVNLWLDGIQSHKEEMELVNNS